MSHIKRTITLGKPFNEGEQVVGTRMFTDGKLVVVGPVGELDNLSHYYTTYYAATVTDEGQPDENVVQEDGKDASGKSNLPSGATESKPAANAGKK